ncbi:Nn.00g085340.m01.CDS01 [Neocucurbitaria sp. VM-36]
MQLTFLVLFLASSTHDALALNPRAAARVAVTNNVLHLRTASNAPHLIPPSSKYLLKRRNDANSAFHSKTRRQDDPIADIQEDLITIGGRVYMTDVTLAGQPFTLVIDSGSSDTWVASSTFQCTNPNTMRSISLANCGFATLYDPNDSSTFSPIRNNDFSIKYTGGEFLQGELGFEQLGIGDVSLDEGFWLGDGISSGLMGLAYPALASGARRLKYKSVMFTLTQQSSINPIFSLALSRPSLAEPRGGGMLAIGGIPDVPHDNNFVTVSIKPLYTNLFAFYTITLDGFDITPPSPSPRSRRSSASTRRQLVVPKVDPRNYSVEAIVDSGTSLVYLDDGLTDYIAAMFSPPAAYNPNTGLYTVPCNAAAPRVGIIIGGTSFYMSEDDLMNRLPQVPGGVNVKSGTFFHLSSSNPASSRKEDVQGGAWRLL